MLHFYAVIDMNSNIRMDVTSTNTYQHVLINLFVNLSNDLYFSNPRRHFTSLLLYA